MIPCPKHDFILHRDLTASERLAPAQICIRFIKDDLESLEYRIKNASNALTEEQLQTICDAVQYAYNAVSNAACLGESGYTPLPVKVVRWEK